MEKFGHEGKLRMVTEFHLLNTHLKWPMWPFLLAEKIRRSMQCEDRVFVKVDLCSECNQISVQESDRDLMCFVLSWRKNRYCELPLGLSPRAGMSSVTGHTRQSVPGQSIEVGR